MTYEIVKYERLKIDIAKNNSACSIIMKQSRVSEAMTRSEIDGVKGV
jgi:hypothetical protein